MKATADPLGVVWDALAGAGCVPKGEIFKFTARCPTHDDRSPSLSVAEGVDRPAVLYCHAGCRTEAVLAAIGLEMRDLFPAGHRTGPRPRVTVPAHQGPAEALISALDA